MIFGPIAGEVAKRVNNLPPVPPVFESLPAYNPSVFDARHPVVAIVIGSTIGIPLIFTAGAFRNGRPWARKGLQGFCLLGIVLCIVTSSLWLLSIRGQTQPIHRLFGIAAPLASLVGIVFFVRAIKALGALGIRGDTHSPPAARADETA